MRGCPKLHAEKIINFWCPLNFCPINNIPYGSFRHAVYSNVQCILRWYMSRVREGGVGSVRQYMLIDSEYSMSYIYIRDSHPISSPRHSSI